MLKNEKDSSVYFYFIFLFSITSRSTSAYAQSADCWKEYSDARTICNEAGTKRNSCTGSDLSSPCYQESDILFDKCDQANNGFYQCLGVDKNPWKLQSSKPGHLSCQEWKMLGIAGTAQNCVAPVTETFEKKLWCLNSAAEISEVRSHPVDYILDFDPYSCITTEDDVKEFKANLSLIPGSSQEISQKVIKNNTKQKEPSPFNFFDINLYQTWLNLVELAQARAFVGTGALDRFTESTILHSAGRETVWEKDARKTEEINRFYYEATERLLKLKGKTGLTDISDNTKKTLIESAEDPVTIKEGSAIINIQPHAGEKGILETGSKLMLKSGAVDVIVEPKNGKSFEMQTPNAEIMVIGTEFSVIYNQKENKTLLAVYKGKVEVKTRDGKNTTVTPDRDNPGVVVVSQKLSIIKLALAGLVLVAVVGGVFMILKRKFISKGFIKKKR